MKKILTLIICLSVLLVSISSYSLTYAKRFTPHGSLAFIDSDNSISKIAPLSIQANTLAATWMSNINNSTALPMLNIPGTHDSGTKYTVIGTGFIASCQDDSIASQLEKGIRYLDIRLNDSLIVNHGGVTCYTKRSVLDKYRLTFHDVLNDVTHFLHAHPTETIIVQIKREGSDSPDTSTFTNAFNELLNKYDNFYYKKKTSTENLTLENVRGKFLIFSRVNDDNLNGVYHYNWSGEGTDQFRCIKLDNKTAYLQDDYTAATKKSKTESINYFYTNAWKANPTNENFLINFVSCVGLYNPKGIAKKMNPIMQTFIKDNPTKRLGIILMDIPEDNIISDIYLTNF